MAKSKNKPKDVSGKKQENKEASSRLSVVEDITRYYELPQENLTFNVILHKMSEILEMYLKTLQQILQPEEFYAIYECNAFAEKDKAQTLELYKRIIITHREILKALILNEEQNSLSTIKFVHQEILGVKVEMLEVVNKIQKSWSIDSKDNASKQMHYFG